MGHHTLIKGKEIIDGILKLGKALGYVAKGEFPLEKASRNPSAVDVAWLSEENHDFPLMIFEVESRVTGAIANNPVKVFGQPNENFEKPLFFFHIFLSCPKDSKKIENLQALFGLYNYRTYDLSGTADHTRLIIDIVAQHKRLYQKIDLDGFLIVMKSKPWKYINLESVLSSIEKHRFLASYLKTYASRYFDSSDFKCHYLRFLLSYTETEASKMTPQDYGTYWGYQWQDPIHYCILIKCYPERQHYYYQRLVTWQEKTTSMSMIGPHLGLSRDYDEFIISLSPPFLGFLSALVKSCTEAVLYIADQAQLILDKLTRYSPNISFFMAIWLLHIAASVSSQKHFEFSREFINSSGGVSADFLYTPPNTIPIMGEGDTPEFKKWNVGLQHKSIQVQSMDEFKLQLRSLLGEKKFNEKDTFDLALEVLLDPGVHARWAQKIVVALAS